MAASGAEQGGPMTCAEERRKGGEWSRCRPVHEESSPL